MSFFWDGGDKTSQKNLKKNKTPHLLIQLTQTQNPTGSLRALMKIFFFLKWLTQLATLLQANFQKA